MKHHTITVLQTEARVDEREVRADDAAVEQAVDKLIAAHDAEFYALLDAEQAKLVRECQPDRREYMIGGR